jgi:Tat protein translocase TatB subunit
MPQIGPLEIAVVLLIALLVFGPNRLPEMARQVGGALRELRRIQQSIRQDVHEALTDESEASGPPPTLPPRPQPADAGSDDRPPGDVPPSGRDEPPAVPPFPDPD